jgi:hypothetical protein
MMSRKSERIEFIGADETTEVLVDLSTGGACCYNDSEKTAGSFIVLNINSVAIRAKVRYCQKKSDRFRLGLQFDGNSTEIQKKIHDLVDQYSKGVPLTCTVLDEEIPERNSK